MADTYTPTDAMSNAAKRALKWKEDGKATGAGTQVGWTRAGQLARKDSLSLDTVKRMYSFFSRHEVDKKGKGFYDGPEFPSNGRIMWDAWGGDAGFSWSRAIVNREKNKDSKINKSDDWHGKDLYDELSSDEKALADSLLKLTNDIGPLDESSGIWVGYEGASENDDASIGVKCGNCALIKNEMNCLIISQQIEVNGICRFAVIPDGYVKPEDASEMDKFSWGGFFKAK